MRTLAFDGRTGASGDMILAALLATGGDRGALAAVEEALGVEYRVGEAVKNGLSATTVDVRHVDGEADRAEGGASRTYAECREIVEEMPISASVEGDAKAILGLLGRAEARVHGTALEDTHFHEVGADDAIADIVGAALLVDDLGVDRIVTTPVAAGGGEVSMSHGVYPVPTPAVGYLASEASWTLSGGPIDAELLTPTGAAVLAHLAEGVASTPPLSVGSVGYGAGDSSFEERPNVLRATVGSSSGRLRKEGVRVLETNVDDVSPEVLGGLQERLSEAGARDVTVVPTTMKKSRPGHLIKVVVRPADVDEVTTRLAAETGTLGVRETAVEHRWVADRTVETVAVVVDGDAHEVGVKIAADDAEDVYDVSAEYDDAAAVAERTGVPIREVMRRAETAYRSREDISDR